MKIKWLPAIIVATIIFNIVAYWGQTLTLLAWLVALAGWVPHMFDKKGETHGNT